MNDDVLERWETLVRESLERKRREANHAWLKAWADCMEDAPPDKLFGSGVWFHAFPRLVFVVPPPKEAIEDEILRRAA